MNLNELNIDELSTLWIISSGNAELRTAIEDILRNRIAKNANFSREYIFKICKLLNHGIGISFIPTSEAFNDYGEHIVIEPVYTEDELIEMIRNYHSNPPVNTSGQIKARLLSQDTLSSELNERLNTIGFSTTEILSIALR